MAQLRILSTLLFLAFMILGIKAFGQDRYVVGVNVFPLLSGYWGSGTPEGYLEVGLSRKFAINVSGGETRTSIRCCTKVEDGVENYNMHGSYLKAGLTYLPLIGKRIYPLAQLRYVASWYNEMVDQRMLGDTTRTLVPKWASGFVNGISISGGGESRLWKGLHVRGLLQFGYYRRNDRISHSTTQPGLGAVTGLFPTEVHFGINYRFGKFK